MKYVKRPQLRIEDLEVRTLLSAMSPLTQISEVRSDFSAAALTGRLDVNQDGFVAPGDALSIVNELNGSDASVDDDMLDVNRDGKVSPLDALLVINHLSSDGLTRTSQIEAVSGARTNAYIVIMADDPIVAYEGGVRGLKATKPAAGEKVDPNGRAVRAYQDHLNASHERALRSAGVDGSRKMYDYTFALNGFAAKLTNAEVTALAARSDVLMMKESGLVQLQTDTTPDYLGLTAPGGAWDLGYDGENIVIGVVDSGIWPQHPSFSDRTGTGPQGQSGKLDYQQIPGWHGKCTPGEDFAASDCNQKLIGAQYFGEGFGGEEGVSAVFPSEVWSARDNVGHGTHVASIAAGNSGVEATIFGEVVGEISGIAPRARISAYKVCWGSSGCFATGEDILAGVDQAVADGVDVVNISLGNDADDSVLGAIEFAALFAEQAGVFVAASGGNDGPGPRTISNEAPWLATVAAGVHFVDPPEIASFSSRGPSLASGDLLGPDVTAPGYSILAALSPLALNGLGLEYAYFSGTSMASPHVAGVGAILRTAHPDWTPAMVKSAIMTTARDEADWNPAEEGSGFVEPNAALDPGLVYDAAFADYVGFLCGADQLPTDVCDDLGIETIDPSDLNLPNITIGELLGSQTVTRTVTNVGPAATYSVQVNAPDGLHVEVSPSEIQLETGESATYEVSFEITADTNFGVYNYGSLIWNDGEHTVRSVISVNPQRVVAPDSIEVFDAETAGSLQYDVTFGYDGPFTAAPHGLIAPNRQDGHVVDDPENNFDIALETGVGVTAHTVNVPENTAYTRIRLFDDFTDGNPDDLDLYVFDPDGEFVAFTFTITSEEEVNLEFPKPGDYTVYVHAWESDGPDANYTLFDWSIPLEPSDGSNLNVNAPTTATLGATATIDVNWQSLDDEERYLGAVSYSSEDELMGFTLLSIRTD